MKSILRYSVSAALVLGTVAGCAAQGATPASEPEPVEEASQELHETTCTVAPTFVKKTVTGTAPTTCGIIQDFSASSSSYSNTNLDTCPFQFVVEVARSDNSAIGSGYYFLGAPSVGGIVTNFADQADCEKKQTSYAVWAFSGGSWTEVGDVWLKGKWFMDQNTIFPCTWGDFTSSGSLKTVPSNATKLRIAASEWTESGTKGADGGDKYRLVQAGIGAGNQCFF